MLRSCCGAPITLANHSALDATGLPLFSGYGLLVLSFCCCTTHVAPLPLNCNLSLRFSHFALKAALLRLRSYDCALTAALLRLRSCGYASILSLLPLRPCHCVRAAALFLMHSSGSTSNAAFLPLRCVYVAALRSLRCAAFLSLRSCCFAASSKLHGPITDRTLFKYSAPQMF